MSREDTLNAIETLVNELRDMIYSIAEKSSSSKNNEDRIEAISTKTSMVLNSVIDKLLFAKENLKDNDELNIAINTARRKSEKLYEEAIEKIRELNNTSSNGFFMEEENEEVDKNIDIPLEVPAIEETEEIVAQEGSREELIEEETPKEEDPIREKTMGVLNIWLKDLEK